MRLTALVASMALIGGLVSGSALAQGCAGFGEADVLLSKAQVFTGPIGLRSVVVAGWKDQPADGDTSRITQSLMDELKKLGTDAVKIVAQPADEQQRRAEAKKLGLPVSPDAAVPTRTIAQVGAGILEDAVVTPDAIRSEPTYHDGGKVFTVNRFSYSHLRAVSVNELKSPTDRYCVVQFTFQAAYTPLMVKLSDAPGMVQQRKGRLLSQINPYQGGPHTRAYNILVADYARLDGDYKTTTVSDTATMLALAR